MTYKYENITQLLKLLQEKLSDAAKILDQRDNVVVEIAATIEGITIKGPKGTVYLIYLGSKHSKKDERNNAVMNNRDIVIGAIAFVKYFSDGMKPDEYVEWINDTLTGIEIENTRPEYERKIYPINDELIDENLGEWKYMVRIGVPVDYIEKQYRIN